MAVAGCKSGATFAASTGQLTVSAPSDTIAKVTFNTDGSMIAVDFGSVPITQRRVETLSLSNVGSSDMTILKVTQDTADAEFSVDVTQGQVLVAGGTAVPIPVHFVPFTTGAKTAKITLTTDSSIVPTVEIDLSGIGIKLSVALNPQQIDFGNVVVNTTATQSLAMTNKLGHRRHGDDRRAEGHRPAAVRERSGGGTVAHA